MPSGKGCAGWSESSASSAKRATAIGPPSRPTAIQAAALTGRLPVAPLARHRSMRSRPRGPRCDQRVAGGQRRHDVAGGEAEMARVDHLVELELQGREGGQRPADACGEEGEAGLSGGWARRAATKKPSSRAPAMFAAKVAQGQEARRGRRLRQADAGEGTDHAARVDRREAMGVGSGPGIERDPRSRRPRA